MWWINQGFTKSVKPEGGADVVGDRPTTTEEEEKKWEDGKNEGSPSAQREKLAVVAPPHGQDESVRAKVTTHGGQLWRKEREWSRKGESQSARRGPDGEEQEEAGKEPVGRDWAAHPWQCGGNSTQ